MADTTFNEGEAKPQRSPPQPPSAGPSTDDHQLALQRSAIEEFQSSWPVECPAEEERVTVTQDVAGVILVEQETKQSTTVKSVRSGGCSLGLGSVNEDSTAVWSHEAILYLLEACENRKHLFHVPGVKKMDIWKQVAEEMLTLGLHYSWEACEKKMRNFRHRYRVIRSNGNRCTKGHKPWIYYDAVDSILSCDPSINQLTEPVTIDTVPGFAVSWPDASYENGLFLECTGNEGDSEQVLGQHQLKLPEGAAIMSKLCDSNSETDVLTEDASSYFIWPRGLIMKLISTCEVRKHLFNTPGMMKKDVWKQIGHEMAKYNPNLSWEACEKKMRNLKHRYKLILNAGAKRYRDRKKWEYFESLRNLFDDESHSSQRVIENDVDSLLTGVNSVQHTSQNALVMSRPTSVHRVSKPLNSTNITAANKLMNNAKRLKTNMPPSLALSSAECPPWFREFALDQKRCLEDILKINKEVLRVAKERNNILRTLTETVLKRDLQNRQEIPLT